MIKKNAEKNAENFNCEKCDFKCCKYSDWIRHLSTRKHLNDNNDNKNGKNDNKKTPEILSSKFVCECGKVYQFRSGLSRHKKAQVCAENSEHDIASNKIEDSELKLLTNLVLEVIKQNKDLVIQNTETQKQNQELTNKIVEISKVNTNPNTQINTDNSINKNNSVNTNNTFNLNMFLNETCKDAMNIMDFVDSLKLQLSDLEDVGRLGFVEGISNIILKNLKALDVTERPIHCADKKREIIYVKDDNKWEKENDQKLRIRRAIKKVASKNEKLLILFKEKHPGCIFSESQYSDQYSKLVIEALGGVNNNDFENETKIIKRIAKEVVIDKTKN